MRLFAQEIELPETKPATEWILGRPVQKAWPVREHSILQGAFAGALDDWAEDQGCVGLEWTLRASPPGEIVHPLVPDIAYMSYARLRPLSAKYRQNPNVAPEIVIEILSAEDRATDLDEKRRVYFAWGLSLFILVDPATRSLNVYDNNGTNEHVGAVEMYAPAIFADLQLPLRSLFGKLDIPEL